MQTLIGGLFYGLVAMAWTAFYMSSLAQAKASHLTKLCFGAMVGMIGVWNMLLAYRTLIGYPATQEGFRAIGAMIPIPIIFEITFRDKDEDGYCGRVRITNEECWPQSAPLTGDFTVNTQHLTTHQTQLYHASVAASNAAGILSAGVLGLELAQKLGFRNVYSNEFKAMMLIPAFGLLTSVVPVEQGKGISAVSFLALYMVWIAGLVKREWFSAKLLLGVGSVSFSILGWEVWTGNHGQE
ncbi:hypothetical protein VHEMI09872 [[Torrubiella] hemipterigena]|uniref:Uncharacterized protein n=1 Tax=[Torrubiella] hemipterigena TaxID=1531966 RepID=A0A0A1THD3_9HYPO|nr:hypothetical protein VHEMI09872 [[Torrubiella] hemipterigena]